MEGGKLGLGSATVSGIQVEFTPVPKLSGIESVVCGPSHTIALKHKLLSENKSGAYAWG